MARINWPGIPNARLAQVLDTIGRPAMGGTIYVDGVMHAPLTRKQQNAITEAVTRLVENPDQD